jgi:hypothetical protein
MRSQRLFFSSFEVVLKGFYGEAAATHNLSTEVVDLVY